MAGPPDVLVVSVDSTTGWSAAARSLVAALRGVGATVELLGTGPVPLVRTFMLTDLVQARLARQVCVRARARWGPVPVIYCSITAALLWPVPGAIWLDALAAENRPGRHGVWQRVVERRRLGQAPVVMPMTPRALDPLPRPLAGTVLIPAPVDASSHELVPAAQRDVAAVAYAGNPEKKRLDFILEQWQQARRQGETLVVAGIDGLKPRPGVQLAGRMAPDAYRALLRRARIFVCAPTREDYGIAPLEALADGCQLVTTPAPGPYAALDVARELDPRLVSDDLATALRAALDAPRPDYAERARERLHEFTTEAVQERLARDVLPRLLPGWSPS